MTISLIPSQNLIYLSLVFFDFQGFKDQGSQIELNTQTPNFFKNRFCIDSFFCVHRQRKNINYLAKANNVFKVERT